MCRRQPPEAVACLGVPGRRPSAGPRWFNTEWTELVAHAKRYVDTCGWPATSSSACSGIRQLVRAPRRVSPLVGWLALRRATNGAGPTQVLRFGEGARPLRSLSV